MAGPMIDFQLIIEHAPALLQGTLVTLGITVLSLAIGFLGGTAIGVAQTIDNKALQYSIGAYVTIIRGTPMLIQIAFLYYAIATWGLGLSAFATAVFAIGINSSAYIAEIVRSGINAVDHGQIEAAYTLGITQPTIMRHIILPQAFSKIIPALGNEAITLVKDSSLASTIGVMELFNEGRTVISTTYDALSTYCAIAILYLIITTIVSYIFSYIESYATIPENHAHD
jgi:His/Glu/Gln/Arg/opine family amino acid ABC transporter permease subunit